MNPVVHNHPLDWYLVKLYNKEAFASLLYGDGEFLVMTGELGGSVMQNGEVVDDRLRAELLASLDEPDQSLVRGTDPNLINYSEYEGRDFRTLWELGKRIEHLIHARPSARTWVDGVVWERAVRAGEFGPAFRAFRHRDVILVGNPALGSCDVLRAALRPRAFVPVPDKNACGSMDNVERHVASVENRGRGTAYLICVGLSAIPLILRLRKLFPVSTFLDLGSTFDVFAGLGRERGWRSELYKKPKEWGALVAANTGE